MRIIELVERVASGRSARCSSCVPVAQTNSPVCDGRQSLIPTGQFVNQRGLSVSIVAAHINDLAKPTSKRIWARHFVGAYQTGENAAHTPHRETSMRIRLKANHAMPSTTTADSAHGWRGYMMALATYNTAKTFSKKTENFEFFAQAWLVSFTSFWICSGAESPTGTTPFYSVYKKH